MYQIINALLRFAMTPMSACSSCGGEHSSASHGAVKHAENIIETAIGAGKFRMLATALKSAGLIDTLKYTGPFTVFAPTDEAFTKLPKGTIEQLLKPENKSKLVSILTYHVVPGKLMAHDVANLHSAKTIQGSEIKVSSEEGITKVDDANIIGTDIECENGVIHIIDAVIQPKQ